MYAGLFMYLLFFILGFAFGAFKNIPNKRKTAGIIDSLEQRSKSHKGMTTYTAVVKYSVGSETYHTKSSYQSTSFKPGKKLTVCYDENNPQNSFVRSGAAIYLCMTACAVTGALMVLKDIWAFFM